MHEPPCPSSRSCHKCGETVVRHSRCTFTALPDQPVAPTLNTHMPCSSMLELVDAIGAIDALAAMAEATSPDTAPQGEPPARFLAHLQLVHPRTTCACALQWT